MQTRTQGCKDHEESGKHHYQINKQTKSSSNELKEMDIYELPDKKFKIIVLSSVNYKRKDIDS